MEFVYVYMPNGGEWEDFEIYLTEEDAMEATRRNKNSRAELFKKEGKKYVPTYLYLVDGKQVSNT